MAKLTPELNNFRRICNAMKWRELLFKDRVVGGYRLRVGNKVEAAKLIEEFKKKNVFVDGMKVNTKGDIVVPSSNDKEPIKFIYTSW